MSKLTEIASRASEGAYGEDSEIIGKIAGLVMAAKFDTGWGPFICGTVGQVGSDGLHEGYFVCPSYGADNACTGAFMRRLNEAKAG